MLNGLFRGNRTNTFLNSIHLMSWFNNERDEARQKVEVHFNTSNVSVIKLINKKLFINFNTKRAKCRLRSYYNINTKNNKSIFELLTECIDN